MDEQALDEWTRRNLEYLTRLYEPPWNDAKPSGSKGEQAMSSTPAIRLEEVAAIPDGSGDTAAGTYERLVLEWDGLTCHAYPRSRRVYWASSPGALTAAADAGVLTRQDFLPATETYRADLEDAERFTVQRVRFYIPEKAV